MEELDHRPHTEHSGVIVFKPEDIVEIIAPDPVPEEEVAIYQMWSGYRAKVIRSEIKDLVFEGREFTKLEPIEERPDSHEPGIASDAWFYWMTDELKLVEPE
jgi:hypothetical protein